ncbi:hypothetical protein [Chryseobacterium sp. MMS23-Vi53]|uniref:hypothetical protein n=1 Tax=Chryseobacterium sp. MMS23-Vi53 TaxID=3386644 RepID=UPI0039EC1BB6
MKTNLLLLFLLGWVGMAFGQDVNERSIFELSFENDTIKVSKTSKDEYISIPIKIGIVDAATWKDYKLNVEVDEVSTLPLSDYEFEEKNFNFCDLQKNKVISIKLKKDDVVDRDRILVLKLKTYNKDKDIEERNIGLKKKIVIIIHDGKDHVNLFNEYNILAYLGTNFDIVESKTKAKNLFFATNIFIPPIERKNKIGFYFSLYGNRTMSDIDSTGNVSRVYKIEPLTDSTHTRYFSQNKMVITRVSDNIGAFISPLIKIFKSSNKHLNLYYSPSLEFIWRKVDITTEFKDPSNLNSNIVTGGVPGTMVMDNISRKIQNEYTFNFGAAGLFLAYQTSAVSFRVHASVGYSSHFYPSNSLVKGMEDESVGRKHDIFFLGRAWLTEAKTGVTLQAEIMNTALHPRPFFGVTLSKAFRLEEIGSIFTPLTDRSK